jgi:CarD family transcriptional regulator
MTVMVPFSHADEVGLRKVTRNGDIARVLCFLATGKCRSNPDWKVRFKDNSEKMRNGSMLEIAEVFKSLLIIQADKPLSFREKKQLDRARQMILTEVCISRGLRECDASVLLDSVLAKSNLRMPEAL